MEPITCNACMDDAKKLEANWGAMTAEGDVEEMKKALGCQLVCLPLIYLARQSAEYNRIDPNSTENWYD